MSYRRARRREWRPATVRDEAFTARIGFQPPTVEPRKADATSGQDSSIAGVSPGHCRRQKPYAMLIPSLIGHAEPDPRSFRQDQARCQERRQVLAAAGFWRADIPLLEGAGRPLQRLNRNSAIFPEVRAAVAVLSAGQADSAYTPWW
jgi:hypothetical protein